MVHLHSTWMHKWEERKCFQWMFLWGKWRNEDTFELCLGNQSLLYLFDNRRWAFGSRHWTSWLFLFSLFDFFHELLSTGKGSDRWNASMTNEFQFQYIILSSRLHFIVAIFLNNYRHSLWLLCDFVWKPAFRVVPETGTAGLRILLLFLPISMTVQG